MIQVRDKIVGSEAARAGLVALGTGFAPEIENININNRTPLLFVRLFVQYSSTVRPIFFTSPFYSSEPFVLACLLPLEARP